MKKLRFRPSKRLLVISLIFILLGISGCAFFNKIPGQIDVIQESTLFILNQGINELSQESANWQMVLQDMQGKLVLDAQATVRNEITQLTNRAIGAAGSQIVCVMDAVPKRALRGLLAIRARYLGEEVPLLEPTLCSVDHDVIDLEEPSASRRTIVYQGYDIENSSAMQLVLVKETGEEYTLENRLFRQTDYKFNVNLAGLQDDFLTEYLKLSIKFGEYYLSDLPILPKDYHPPETKKIENITPPSLTYMPPRTGGDREFAAHGPHIEISVWVHKTREYVFLNLDMFAQETKSDWTTAKGKSQDHRVYDAPPGWHIKEIVGKTSWEAIVAYTDSDEDVDPFNRDLGQFRIKGDNQGEDAGRQTQVNVTFSYKYTIVIEKDSN